MLQFLSQVTLLPATCFKQFASSAFQASSIFSLFKQRQRIIDNDNSECRSLGLHLNSNFKPNVKQSENISINHATHAVN